MQKKLIFLFTLGALTYFNAQDKAEQAIKTLQEKYPQEKIHLLFNKENYVAGENIWFKSFVFDGYSSSDISTSLFVELYDKNKIQISKKLFPLMNGEGSGSISLPETLKEDVYYIRAYTTWMTNFSEDFQLVKGLAVYNPSSSEKLVKDSISAWLPSAYPESGSFIEGIKTKFAVRLQSKGILPSNWTGYIVDLEKPSISITNFKGFDQNVGSFIITPQSGKKYQLIVEDDKGNKQSIDLPTVASSGISLQVESNADAVVFNLQSKNISNGSEYYKILGTINNQLVYKARLNKTSAQSYSIPTNKLINGILQLTVFDDHENVVAQRLCFVQPDVLSIKKPNIQSLSLNKSPRASNSFNIAKNDDEYNYTILILDGNATSSEDENSLLSTLWLTGDITSKITYPSQYFSKNRNVHALDALLISEKWKRFDWKYIMSGTYPVIRSQPQNYLSYKGKVNILGKPAPDTDLNLIFDSGSGTKFYQVKTDNNGFFTLNNLIFENSLKFSYQLNTTSKENINGTSVFFQPKFSFTPYNKSLPASEFVLTTRSPEDKPLNETVRSIAALRTQKIINDNITSIEEIIIKGQKKDKTKKLNSELSSALFKGANEQIFDFVNDTQALGSTNILQWLQGRVAGLQLQSQNGSYIPYFRGSQIAIYLDEMPIDPNRIGSLPVSDIAMVKIIKGFFGGGNGGIAIYSRRGGSAGSLLNTNSLQLRQITINGYDKETPFNNPIYDNEKFKKISQDTRTVLYWDPYVQTQQKEASTIQFYNNDDAKKYKVIILGYDKKNDTPVYYNEIIE